jgi:hypothetical protein
MKHIQFLGTSKFNVGILVGVVLFSTSALNSQFAAASGTEVSTAHGAMTFEFPDVVYDASGDCINPSFNVYLKSFVPQGDWYVDITIRKNGQSPTGSDGRAMGTSAGPSVGTIQICPNLDGVGAFIVDGVFTTFDNGPSNSRNEKAFTSSVNVQKGKSVLVLSALKRSGSNVSLSGNVTGATEKYGMVGLSGTVRVDYQLKNSTKWLALTNVYTGQSGTYKISVIRKLPKNVLFRVKFVETNTVETSEVQKVA